MDDEGPADLTWSIRKLVRGDARAIGAMHLRAWLETYVSTELGIDAAWIERTSPMSTHRRAPHCCGG